MPDIDGKRDEGWSPERDAAVAAALGAKVALVEQNLMGGYPLLTVS